MNRLTVVSIATGILLLAVVISATMMNKKNSLPVLDTLGGDFSLPATTGQDIRLSTFRGKVVLLNFGFTSCPDVCPTALAKMKAVIDLTPDGTASIQPVFVTIDPERDSIDKLQRYLTYFHPSIIGMRGNAEQLKEVATLYKVLYQRETLDSALKYGFLHNDHIYLIDQQGNVRAMYSGSSSPQLIADQIQTLM